jgi:putative mRNA 3-end processing factor
MNSLRITKHGTGILLRYGNTKLAFDTGASGFLTLLSHSHADHIGQLHKANAVIATKGTLDTLEARGKNLSCKPTIIKNGDTLGKIGYYVTALNAGHVLGSSMFRVEFDDGLSVLYTGDFNTVDSIVHQAAIAVETDVLITEATYGTPQWIFPERRGVHRDIVGKAKEIIEAGKIPVFRAYSLGKAQEAIALLYHSGISTVSGNKAVDTVSSVYNDHGRDFEFVPSDSLANPKELPEAFAIVSSSPKHARAAFIRGCKRKDENAKPPETKEYNLSGWTLLEYKNRGFPLSAHSDFPHLLAFAKAVNPRVVYCFTGNARILSRHLDKGGINAVPLE